VVVTVRWVGVDWYVGDGFDAGAADGLGVAAGRYDGADGELEKLPRLAVADGLEKLRPPPPDEKLPLASETPVKATVEANSAETNVRFIISP